MSTFLKNRLRTGIGAGLAALVGIGTVFTVGRISQFEALDLLESILPTMRFFCAAVMTSSATTLALMVTLLSLSRAADASFKPLHYQRIRLISFLGTIAFSGGMILLLVLMVPVAETEAIPVSWYRIFYYGVLIWAAILGALVVATIMMMYTETKHLITTFVPAGSSPITETEEMESVDEPHQKEGAPTGE